MRLAECQEDIQKRSNDGSHQGVTVSHYGRSFLRGLQRHEHILSANCRESLCVTQFLLQPRLSARNISPHDDCTHLMLVKNKRQNNNGEVGKWPSEKMLVLTVMSVSGRSLVTYLKNIKHFTKTNFLSLQSTIKPF